MARRPSYTRSKLFLLFWNKSLDFRANYTRSKLMTINCNTDNYTYNITSLIRFFGFFGADRHLNAAVYRKLNFYLLQSLRCLPDRVVKLVKVFQNTLKPSHHCQMSSLGPISTCLEITIRSGGGRTSVFSNQM